MQPKPQIAAAEAEEQLSRRTESAASQSSTGAGQLPQPELRVPDTSANSPSSDPFDDVTAELLGLRERQAEVQPRDSRSASARSALSSSIKEIVGLPLAIWAFLDTLLPEPLRAGTLSATFIANIVERASVCPSCCFLLNCGGAYPRTQDRQTFALENIDLCCSCSSIVSRSVSLPHSLNVASLQVRS